LRRCRIDAAEAGVEQGQPAHALRMSIGKPCRGACAHRVGDDRQPAGRELLGDGGEVGGEVADAVRRTYRPVALAMPAQIRRHEAEVAGKEGHQRIPPVRVSAVAVHQQNRRRVVAPPDQAVQPQITGADLGVTRQKTTRHGGDELVGFGHLACVSCVITSG
jgi:hypothetical protein